MNMTAGQLAERLGRPDSLTAERIKHWIKLRLLRPIGRRKPGTGRHLAFDELALVDAAILTALADHGVRLVELHRDLRRQTGKPSSLPGALALSQEAWCRWCEDSDAPAFLVLAGTMDPYKRRIIFTADIGNSAVALPEDAISATVVDLRRVFQQISWDPAVVQAARAQISERGLR
jgi:hypothetical protein